MSVAANDMEEFRGQLSRMVTEGWVGRVTLGIETAIASSFHDDAILRPVLTRDEVRRRFRICVEGFCVMRRDLGYAVPRIIDELPRYLRAKLDGGAWNPPAENRKGWLVEGAGAPAVAERPDLGDGSG